MPAHVRRSHRSCRHRPAPDHAVQVLRTYGRRAAGYAFAPRGERSVARGYLKALIKARTLIYLEDQYLWSRDAAHQIAHTLRAQPRLHVIAVLPHHPDQAGRISMPPNVVARQSALSIIRAPAPDRVAVYGIENHAGTPVYVHAKVCVIDDLWACVGSDNFNRRSWTHDSELSAAVLDLTPEHDGGPSYARELRLALAREHLDRDLGDTEPGAMFDAFARSAAALQDWHHGDRRGPRPQGRLSPLRDPPTTAITRLWAQPLYHLLYDPDARSLTGKLRGSY
jgi:phosphatidylserine/phosphatidylglycerophosphate/cardiolipin synthase-like enzyme